MTITVELDPDVETLLLEESRRSGETLDQAASRVLSATLLSELSSAPGTQTFALDIPEKWRGLTPNQIDYEMEMEEYEGKLERAQRGSTYAHA